MARLSVKVWENRLLTTNAKMQFYRACVLSALLYDTEARTLNTHQERRLNTIHLRSLRRILGSKWQDHSLNASVLELEGIPSMFALLSQKRLADSAMADGWMMDESPKTSRMVNLQLAPDALQGPYWVTKTPVNAIWRRGGHRPRETLTADRKVENSCQDYHQVQRVGEGRAEGREEKKASL